MVRGHSLGSVAQSQGESGDALLHGVAPVTAGMDHQILGADRDGALHLAAEGVDGLGADHRIERCQVDQIIDVDHQRRKVEALACGLQQTDLDGVGKLSAPHARTRREDLKGGSAEVAGGQGRRFKSSGGEGVYAEAQCPMLPDNANLSYLAPFRRYLLYFLG